MATIWRGPTNVCDGWVSTNFGHRVCYFWLVFLPYVLILRCFSFTTFSLCTYQIMGQVTFPQCYLGQVFPLLEKGTINEELQIQRK